MRSAKAADNRAAVAANKFASILRALPGGGADGGAEGVDDELESETGNGNGLGEEDNNAAVAGRDNATDADEGSTPNFEVNGEKIGTGIPDLAAEARTVDAAAGAGEMRPLGPTETMEVGEEAPTATGAGTGVR